MFIEFICKENTKFEKLSDIFVTSNEYDNSLLEYGDTEILMSIINQEDYENAFKYKLFDNDILNIIDIIRNKKLVKDITKTNKDIYNEILINEINVNLNNINGDESPNTKTVKHDLIIVGDISDQPEESSVINTIVSSLTYDNIINNSSKNNLIIQVFTMNTKSMYLIVQHLKNYYDNVYIYKPELNSNMTWEKYIVCSGRNNKKYINSEPFELTDDSPYLVPNKYYLDSSFNAIKEVNGKEFAIMIKKIDFIKERLMNGIFTETLINEYHNKQLENDNLYIKKWFSK